MTISGTQATCTAPFICAARACHVCLHKHRNVYTQCVFVHVIFFKGFSSVSYYVLHYVADYVLHYVVDYVLHYVVDYVVDYVVHYVVHYVVDYVVHYVVGLAKKVGVYSWVDKSRCDSEERNPCMRCRALH